jgi:catechol 2,3-dioxygenase-like lactoylglutathione lyase family enzyme
MSHANKADKLLIKPTAGARPASPCTLGQFIPKARNRGLTPDESRAARRPLSLATAPDGPTKRLSQTPEQSFRTVALIVRLVPEYAVPIMPSKDLDATLSFYERLGFENAGSFPPEWNYLIIRRGSLQLHFYGDPGVDPLTISSSCYIYTDDADALHATWNAIGVQTDPTTGSRLQRPVDTEYGMREFALVDPSGNLVRVGSPPFA